MNSEIYFKIQFARMYLFWGITITDNGRLDKN